MRSATSKTPKGEVSELAGYDNLTIGEIVKISADGHIFVSCVNRNESQMPAKLTARLASGEGLKQGARVLLAFCCEYEAPIVIDLIRDSLEPNYESPIHRVLDGDTLVLEAGRQITLKCGKSTITLTKDGKVVVRGTKVISRASSVNKIKGSTVLVN